VTELPVKVLSITVASSRRLAMPLPLMLSELLVKVLSRTVNVPALKTPPPKVPAELPVKVLPRTVPRRRGNTILVTTC
jgi:hypothetical protein